MGIYWSMITQIFPPASKFKVEDIPDLSGKVMIVTGGNAGIGKETVKALLAHNAKVYIAARNKDKVENAIRELQTTTGKEAIFLELDLADLASVRKSAEEFLSKENELHVLFNNAGVMWTPLDQLSKDGYDLQFGTNVLGHFFFTQLLMPALLSGAKTSPDRKARIITTSSAAMYLGGLHHDTYVDSPARRKLGTKGLYFQSKFANVVVTRELARRYGDQGIVSISVNPGNIKTDLQQYANTFEKMTLKPILYSAPYGALTQLYAGTSHETVDMNGKFLIPWARLGRASKATDDPEIAKKLWTWLEEQIEGK